MATQFGGLLGAWPRFLTPEEEELERQRIAAIQAASMPQPVAPPPEFDIGAEGIRDFMREQQYQAEPLPEQPLPEQPLSNRMQDVATAIETARNPEPIRQEAPRPSVKIAEDDDYEISLEDIMDRPIPVVVAKDGDWEISLEDTVSQPVPKIETRPNYSRIAKENEARARAELAAERNVTPDQISVTDTRGRAFDSMVEGYVRSKKNITATEIRQYANRISKENFDGEFTISPESAKAYVDFVKANPRAAGRAQVIPDQRGQIVNNETQQAVAGAMDANGKVSLAALNRNNQPTGMQSVGQGAVTLRGLTWSGIEAGAEVIGADGVAKTAGSKREFYNALREAAPQGVSLSEIDSLSDAVQWASQTLGNQGAMLAAPIAGSAAGRVLAGSLGARLGAIPAGLAMGVGTVQEANKNADPDVKATWKTLAGGGAIAALESIMPVGVGKLLVERMGKEAAEDVARRMLLMNMPERIVEMGKRASVEGLRGARAEGITEGLQTAIEEVASSAETGKPITPGMLGRMAEAAFTGAVVGSTIRGGASVATDTLNMGRQRRADEVTDATNRTADRVIELDQIVRDSQQTPAQEDIEIVEARPVTGMRTGPVQRVRPTDGLRSTTGEVQEFSLPEGKITSRVGPRKSFRTENGAMASSNHKGTDVAMKLGAPVIAGADGVVLKVRPNAGGYGKQVVLGFSDGTTASYSHNSSIVVAEGQEVKKGETIAKAGKTGNATGVHSHVELRDRAGRILNPATGKPVRITVGGSKKVPVVKDDTPYDVAYEDEANQLDVPEVIDTTEYQEAWETYTGTRFEDAEEASAPAATAAPASPAPAESARPATPPPATQPVQPLANEREARENEVPLYDVAEDGTETLIGYNNEATGQPRFFGQESRVEEPLLSQEPATSMAATAREDPQQPTSPSTEPLISQEPLPELQLRSTQAVAAPDPLPAQNEPVSGPIQGPPQAELQLRNDQRADVIFRDPFPATGGLELTNEERDRPDLVTANINIGALDNLVASISSSQPNEEGRIPLPSGTRGEAVAALRDIGVDIRQSDLTIAAEDAALLQEEGPEAVARRYAQREDTLELAVPAEQAEDLLANALRSVPRGNEAAAAGFEAGARRALGLTDGAMDADVATKIANDRRFRAGFDRGETVATNLAANTLGWDNPTQRMTPSAQRPPAAVEPVAGAVPPTLEAPATDATEQPAPAIEAATETVTPEVAAPEETAATEIAEQAIAEEAAPDPRIELLATLPKPPANAAPAVAAARLRGQEAGLGLVKPENLKSKSAAYKTAYNLGRKEAEAALQRSEAVEPVATAEAQIVGPVSTPPETGTTTPAPESSPIPIRGQKIAVALANVGDKGRRLDPLVARGLQERGLVETDDAGVSRLTAQGRTVMAETAAAQAKVDKADDRLFDLENDGTKAGIRAFVKKLVKEGVITQDQADAYEPMFKDKDMGVEDIASEVRTDLELYLEGVVERNTGEKYSRGRRREPFDPDRRAKLDEKMAELLPVVEAQMNAELERLGLANREGLSAEVVSRVRDDAEGLYDPRNPLMVAIKIAALNNPNPAQTTRHEAVHYLRDKGIISETQWNILAKWAQNQPGLMKWAREMYDGPDVPANKRLTEDQLIEEAVAEGTARRTRGANDTVQPLVVRIMEKIGQAVDAVRSVLSRNGLTRQEREEALAIIADIGSGALVRRFDAEGGVETSRGDTQVRESRTAPVGARLGDAPVPNPGIFRRMSQAALFGLDKIAAVNTSRYATMTPDTTDTLGAAIERKLIQKHRQAFRVQGQIENFLGYPVPEEADLRGAIVADERGYRLAWLRDKLVVPMSVQIAKRKVDMKDLGLYLYARHAEARNIRVAAENKEFNLTDKPGSGMRTDVARQILADFATSGKDADLAAVADYVDRIIDFARDEKINARLLTPTDIANGFQPGDKFVPLRGHDTEPEHEYNFGASTGGGSSGFSTKGKESPTMYGRSSMADPEQIIGNVIALATSSVVRSYEARVGQTALKMFQMAAAQGLTEPRFVQIDPVTRRAVWVKDNSPQGGHVEYQMQTRLDATQEPYTLFVKQDGQEYKMVFDRSNPSAVRMVKSLKNLEPAKFNVAMRLSGLFVAWTRWTNTQASPVFIATNPVRDVQTGLVNASSLKIPGLRRAMLANIIKGGPLIGAFRNNRMGKGDKSAVTGAAAEWVRIAEEADANGGILNYAQSLPMEAAIIDLQNAVKDAGRGALNPKKMARSVVNGIEVFTSATENMTRLAAYKALRDKGMPAKKAAEKVRELTTNFSQHGEWGPGLSMMYAFANANIIGNARTVATFIAKPSTFASLVSLGATSAIINSMFGDDEDDPDAKRYSEEELDKMLVLPTRGLIGRDLTVPIGYGINVPITFGRKMAELAMGKRNEDGSKMTPMDAVSAMVHSTATAFSPISGQSLLTGIMPTIGDIPAALYDNKNWFGKPIYKEQSQNGTPTPASERMWKKTEDSWWAAATRALNDWTNGADDTGTVSGSVMGIPTDISPDGAKYVVDQLIGGLGRTIIRSIEMPLDSKDDVWTDHPLVKPFTREPGGSLTKEDRNFNNFRERMEALDNLNKTDEQLYLRGSAGREEFMEENKGLYNMIAPEEGEDKSLFDEARSMDKRLTDGMSALRKARTFVNGFKDERQRNAVAKAAGVPKSSLPMGQRLTPAQFQELRTAIEANQAFLAEEFNRTYREKVLERED